MRAYFTLIAVLIALTALMAVQDVAILVILFTFGLGMPLIFAGTALILAVCGLPLAWSWSGTASERALGAALTALAAAFVTVGPGHLAAQHVETERARLAEHDHAPATPVTAASVEIRRPANNYDHTFADQQTCGFECRALLLKGEVQWVRIVMRDGGRNAKGESTTRYVVKRGSACAVPGGGTGGSSTCVVMAPDTSEPAELVVTFHKPERIEAKNRALDLVRWRDIRRVTAVLQRNGSSEEILKRTGMRVDIPSTPAIIGPRTSGMSSRGIDFLRREIRSQHLTLTQTLAALGYQLDQGGAAIEQAKPRKRDWRDGIDEDMTRDLMAVLALPQTQPFDPEQAKPVSTWLTHARQINEWTPELIEMLRRILHDRRIRRPTSFDQVFERQRPVTEALMPDVLTLLESQGIGQDYTPERQAAYTFHRLDPALLSPHAPRIVPLIRRDTALRGILTPAAGRLGIDPTPFLLPFKDDLDPRGRSPHAQGLARVRGACLSEARWWPHLIPALRSTLEETPAGQQGTSGLRAALLKTLAHLGDIPFVEDQLARAAPQDKQVGLQIRSGLADERRKVRLCQF